MSESTGASSGGNDAGNVGSSGSADVTPNTSNETSESSGQDTRESAGAKAKTETPKAGAQTSEDGELEEIKVGSVTGKVPKQIAAMIKNLERGFQSKAQEAASKEKLLALGKQNPKEFFKQTGVDVYDFAESILAEKYEEMQMDPRDRELRDLKRQNEERETQERASKQEVLEALKEFGPLPKGAENASKEELIDFYRHQKQVYQNTQQSLDLEMGNAFKESGLEPDRHLLAKVAFEMSSALKRGKDLSPKDAIAKVKGEWFSGVKQTLSRMDAKQIHEELGDELLEKLQKYGVDQVTANAALKFGQSTKSPGAQSASSGPKKEVNQFEWRKLMGID